MKTFVTFLPLLALNPVYAESSNPLCRPIAQYIANNSASDWNQLYHKYKTICSDEFTSDSLESLDLSSQVALYLLEQHKKQQISSK